MTRAERVEAAAMDVISLWRDDDEVAVYGRAASVHALRAALSLPADAPRDDAPAPLDAEAVRAVIAAVDDFREATARKRTDAAVSVNLGPLLAACDRLRSLNLDSKGGSDGTR